MKKLYMILYIVGGALMITAILGGNLSKFIFKTISQKTLDQAGIKKQSVDSLDNTIDEILYFVNNAKLKIENLKEFFGGLKLEKYKKQKNQLIYTNIYNPALEILSTFYRFATIFISLSIILIAVIIQVIYRNIHLRRRVEKMEEILKKQNLFPTPGSPDGQ